MSTSSSDVTASLDKGDRIKQSKAIRSLVKSKAVKNYSLSAITAAIKVYAATRLGLGTSMTYLMENSNLRVDLSKVESYLIAKRYLVKNYCILQ
ncbi:12602_t:CDS:2 [Cetraspora pellucida]|uniref:12602_t:CDS:1 n=1 Tax=Cetraspora pellucida TaxID=1433469 RepID=A0A9N9CSK1_9GLOM|nr:12602_t:CDS:2 [Cetraspora pellucida]